MKNKDYRLRKQLYELRSMAKNGTKSVVWKLSKEQMSFLAKYYEIEPYLYTIKTKKFVRIYDIHDSLLKDIHYNNKRGKKEMVRRFSNEQKELLDRYDVMYKPYKYRIVLIKRWIPARGSRNGIPWLLL